MKKKDYDIKKNTINEGDRRDVTSPVYVTPQIWTLWLSISQNN